MPSVISVNLQIEEQRYRAKIMKDSVLYQTLNIGSFQDITVAPSLLLQHGEVPIVFVHSSFLKRGVTKNGMESFSHFLEANLSSVLTLPSFLAFRGGQDN